MNELHEKYTEAKNIAINFMKTGRISAHIAQLVLVQELKLQLINKTISPGK
jgi:hypothetical protein